MVALDFSDLGSRVGRAAAPEVLAARVMDRDLVDVAHRLDIRPRRAGVPALPAVDAQLFHAVARRIAAGGMTRRLVRRVTVVDRNGLPHVIDMRCWLDLGREDCPAPRQANGWLSFPRYAVAAATSSVARQQMTRRAVTRSRSGPLVASTLFCRYLRARE
jgi:hypothetical protein